MNQSAALVRIKQTDTKTVLQKEKMISLEIIQDMEMILS